jgi:hypothetical protein
MPVESGQTILSLSARIFSPISSLLKARHQVILSHYSAQRQGTLRQRRHDVTSPILGTGPDSLVQREVQSSGKSAVVRDLGMLQLSRINKRCAVKVVGESVLQYAERLEARWCCCDALTSWHGEARAVNNMPEH